MAICLVLLGGCRQEPGQCSGAANRLCIIYEQPGITRAPDALAVTASAGSHTLAKQDVTTSLQQALAQRSQYVFEIDLSMIAGASSVTVVLSPRRLGETLGTQSQTWHSGQTPVLTFVFGPQQDMAMAPPPDFSGTNPDFSGTNPDLSTPPDASAPVWISGSAAAAITAAGDLSAPTDVCWDGSRLFVSDYGHNRIVYYNLSVSGGQPQLGALTAITVSGAVTALSTPTGLSCTPGSNYLFVADTGNNRVLAFSTTSMMPVAVAGQSNFTSVCKNRGSGSPCVAGAAGPSTLAAPQGVFLDVGNTLYIADTGNYRVVGYQAPDASHIAGLSSASATVVLGQKDLTTGTAPSGANAGTLKQPIGIAATGGRVAVADNGYYRILVYPAPTGLPAGGSPLPADAVIGQTSLTGMTTGSSSTGLYAASRLAVLGGETAVADTYNNRVVIYEQGLPPAGTLGLTGQVVLGQTAFGQASAGTGPAQLTAPTGVALGTLTAAGVTKTFLAAADSTNNRVVIYVKGQP